MTRRRGRPRPQGIFKNFGQKNFGLNFRSLTIPLESRRLQLRWPDSIESIRRCLENPNPNLLFLAFLDFLAFFLFKEFLTILSVFPFFPRILGVRLATSLAFYRSQKGLSLENSEKKSEKGFPGPLGPGVEEAQKKSKKS